MSRGKTTEWFGGAARFAELPQIDWGADTVVLRITEDTHALSKGPCLDSNALPESNRICRTLLSRR